MALACVLGGCGSSGPATDGPLSRGANGEGSACAPARVGQPRAFGFEFFTNQGHTTVVLDRVALLHPRHERMVGSYAVPGTLYIGVGPWLVIYYHDSAGSYVTSNRFGLLIAADKLSC